MTVPPPNTSSVPADPRRNFSIAFGLERIGLIAVKAPVLSLGILVALCVGAFFGLQGIKIDDSLSQLFRSDTPEYKQYEEVTKRFPSSEYDVLVVVEGKSLLARNSLEKLRDLVTDLQLVDGTRGIISLFSARQPPENGNLPAALSLRRCRRGRRIRTSLPRSEATRSFAASCCPKMARWRLSCLRSIRRSSAARGLARPLATSAS